MGLSTATARSLGLRVVTTRKRVFLYKGNQLVGEAGVVNAKDFDERRLTNMAIHYAYHPYGGLK